jgi:hypothetical protein
MYTIRRMKRTQIYLEEEHYRALRERARKRGTSLAAVLREILDEGLKIKTANAAPEKDPLDDVIGLAKGTGDAVAENVSDFLYGKRR